MAGVVSQTTLSGGVAVSPYSAFNSSLSVSGGGYTILGGDGYSLIEVTTGASDRAITLPSASANAGRVIRFKKIDSGIGGVIITGTIDGGTANRTIKAQWGYATVQSDGTNWLYLVDIQESGSFTPVPTYAAGTPTINLASGRYSRSGRRVFFQIDIAFRIGTGSGAFTVTGLPYSEGLAGNPPVAIGYADNVLMASVVGPPPSIMVLYAAVSGTVINFYTKLHNNTATSMATASATQFVTAGSDMRLFLSGHIGLAN